MINKSIKIAEEEYKAKVVSVVIDNESKMEKLCQLLLKERNDFNIYVCAAHWMQCITKCIVEV